MKEPILNNNTSSKILFSSSKMSLAIFISRILGLIREQLIAFTFGASWLTDAFWVAYRIPNMLRDLLAEGAFSSAYIPVLTELKQKKSDGFPVFIWSMMCVMSFISLVVVVLLIIFTPQILTLISPSFFDNPEKFELTVNLARIMIPYLLLVSIAALLTGTLNTIKIFFIPALAPACFNLSIIVSIFFLSDFVVTFGVNKVYVLALGVTIGGILQILIQVPSLLKNNLIPNKKKVIISGEIKKVMGRVGLGALGMSAGQINIIVSTILATGSMVGAISWLTYSFRLFQLPVGILSIPIAGSNLVYFSDAWKSKKQEKAIKILRTSITISFMLMIPSSILLFIFSDIIISIVFERGAFGVNDVLNTSLALKCYVIGLPFYGMYKILTPVFYSIDKTRVTVIISTFVILINIIFCIFLIDYGFHVLAIGATVSILLNCALQIYYLIINNLFPITLFFNFHFCKLILLNMLLCFVSSWVNNSFNLIVFLEEMPFLSGVIFCTLMALFYLISIFSLGIESLLFDFLSKVRKKLF